MLSGDIFRRIEKSLSQACHADSELKNMEYVCASVSGAITIISPFFIAPFQMSSIIFVPRVA